VPAGLAERDEGFENFAFEALHVFEGDVEEVAGATGGIQDAGVAELAMEVQRGVDGLLGVAGVDEVGDGGDGIVPVGAKWLNEGRDNEAFDVSAGCVVRAEGVTFGGVEGAFEECSEDGGFDVAPVGVGGINEEAELIPGEWERGGGFEETAIELEDVALEYGREAPGVHGVPEG
jgi:hypothetical protein